MSRYDFGDISQDVFSNVIGGFATLHELYQRRNLSRSDRATYDRVIQDFGPNLGKFLEELHPDDLLLLRDWLHVHAERVGLTSDNVMMFLDDLASKEGYRNGGRSLVEAALHHPLVHGKLLEYFDELLRISQQGQRFSNDRHVNVFVDLTLLDSIARRTILPWLLREPDRLSRLIDELFARAQYDGIYRLVALMIKYDVPATQVGKEKLYSVLWALSYDGDRHGPVGQRTASGCSARDRREECNDRFCQESGTRQGSDEARENLDEADRHIKVLAPRYDPPPDR